MLWTFAPTQPKMMLRIDRGLSQVWKDDGFEDPMNPDRFVKVFDVLDSGFRDWIFSAFGLIFVAIGIVIAVFPKIVKAAGIPFLDVQSRTRRFSRYVFLGFAILWTTISFSMTYSQYHRHKALAQENGCRIVEGPVEHFVPMPWAGHPVESFSVSGVLFSYSDFNVTDGFNNTSSHGGPINRDSYVRICYDPAGNVILRLEIRDFKGDLKDYGKTESIFPKRGDIQKLYIKNPAMQMPWYDNLFVVLYFLDFLAIQTLFLPYIRTFFCIKTVPILDCPVPEGLEPGKKIKLRNSMIFWDRENRAIWLRPRGFNLIQVPLTTAKLKVDASDRSIVEDEIRFSSGFPFVMALFLWTAYRLFSAAMAANANAPPLALFGGIAALVIVIGGFLNLRILRSRMEKLVQDALSELKDMQALGL